MIDVNKYKAQIPRSGYFGVFVGQSDMIGNPEGYMILSIDEAIEFVKKSDYLFFELNMINEHISEDFNIISHLIWYIYSKLPANKVHITEIYLNRVKENLGLI